MTRMILILALALLTAGVLRAQPAASQPAVPAELLKQLDAADWRKRESATLALLGDANLTIQALGAAYQQAKSPEQKVRLETILHHHLLRRIVERLSAADQPAALGITHNGQTAKDVPAIGKPGIRVVTTCPGFPAASRLMPGDFIVEVDHKPFSTDAQPEQLSLDFRNTILAHRSGQTLSLKVVRDGKAIDLDCPLAAGEALTRLFETTTGGLRPPFDQRWEQLLKMLREGKTLPPQTLDEPEP